MQSQQNNKILSKYRECQDCKHKFILPISALITESKVKNIHIFCPQCQKENIAIISREQYYKNSDMIL